MRPRRALALLAALSLGACHGRAPSWRPDAPPQPGRLAPQAPGAGTVRFGAEEPQAGAVGRLLGDPGLSRLLEDLLRGSPTLSEAAARVREARALANRSARERLPRVDGAAAVSSRRDGADGDLDAYSASVEASWELDFFGRLARAADAAAADAAAAEEDLLALRLVLEADAALAWIDLASARGEETVARETASLYERTRDLLQARIDAGLGGVGAELAVHRVEGDLSTARAAVPEARLRAALARHRLALLTGRPPDAVVGDPALAPAAAPASLALGVPAGLLRRRPDVRAAERRLEADHARVQEAWAAFWPTVTLDVSGGAQGFTLADLLTGDVLFGVISPRLRVPLLDGGRLQAERLAREAARDAAAAQWVGTCLKAFAEVADAAESVAARREALTERRAAEAAARKAVEAADTLFQARLVGYLDVIESQRALATTRLAVVRGERDLRASLVGLVKALAGGW